ncbi:hypothetical protein FisN_3Lh414 [Fistulifera solaris]|uniref:Uncharacterized protein n=1 Tax=Fistulifera solaris TaxID=1519565 RepID=A0A1Z5J897_FISSO|nr:hypothetical protein FisN_3Lh414 [Fistulifera solaris]|eukprot:GAX10217.1 hypothetical protein FisN_3Lh414 [Fistulifera solaris]
MGRNGESSRSQVDQEPSKNQKHSEQQDNPAIEHVRGLLNSIFYGIAPADSKEENVNPKEPEKENEGGYADQVMAAIRIDDHIPTEPNMIRKTKLFQSAYKAIQWQRDNYLAGTEYANWRKSEREKERERPIWHRNILVADIPYDPTALGHVQFSKLAVDFLPSEAMQNAILPLIVGLPMGPIFPLALSSVLSLIPSQQTRLDHVVKSSILTYLDNPANRVAIKNTTQGFIYRRSGGGPQKQSEPTMSSRTP